MARQSGKEQADALKPQAPRRQRMPTPPRWRSGCPMRSACTSASIIAASGGMLQIHYRDLDQLDDVLRKLEVK